MQKYAFDDIYMTLLGDMVEAEVVPGIENAYAPGSRCERLYDEAMDAYERLRQRLSTKDEDPDVEIIIGNLLAVQHILCQKMFHYGQLLR